MLSSQVDYISSYSLEKTVCKRVIRRFDLQLILNESIEDLKIGSNKRSRREQAKIRPG